MYCVVWSFRKKGGKEKQYEIQAVKCRLKAIFSCGKRRHLQRRALVAGVSLILYIYSVLNLTRFLGHIILRHLRRETLGTRISNMSLFKSDTK